jgi:hypothetical protein
MRAEGVPPTRLIRIAIVSPSKRINGSGRRRLACANPVARLPYTNPGKIVFRAIHRPSPTDAAGG